MSSLSHTESLLLTPGSSALKLGKHRPYRLVGFSSQANNTYYRKQQENGVKNGNLVEMYHKEEDTGACLASVSIHFWPCWVLGIECGLFIAVHGLLPSCDVQA